MAICFTCFLIPRVVLGLQIVRTALERAEKTLIRLAIQIKFVTRDNSDCQKPITVSLYLAYFGR